MTQMSLMSSPTSSPINASSTVNEPSGVAFVKGGKRKRLSKACDACHKSKRRCDGTAPCSNCYFASKECTYTDSAGRPVPAPRNAHPALGADPAATDRAARPQAPSGSYRTHVAGRSDPTIEASTSRGVRRPAEAENTISKRPRPEPLGVTITNPLGSASPVESPSSPPSPLLDPATTHELTNLFFTHCNPARLIIHKPAFSAALAHEQIPSYLVLAVCANAAPHSKELGAKAQMPRLAGVQFFQAAVSIMFDSSFRLLAEPNLYTAQALCLLEMHEVAASHAWTKHYRYFDLALQILEESLDIANPDQDQRSPASGPADRSRSIQRECTRRCFWLIQLMSWINGIYTFRAMRPRCVELMRQVRLPCDETSFELAVENQGPEFMHTPGPRTKYASQFGHLCRVLSMYQTFETALANKEGAELQYAVAEGKRAVDIWTNSLPDHLRFTEENLDKQLEMFETSSNTGAWCFCFMHVLHPCLVLSLVETEGGSQREESIDWVRNQLKLIFAAIGHRAKNTILSACALWSYSKYQPNDPQLMKWDDDFEKIWGFRVCVVADQWRKAQAKQREQLGRTYPVESASHQSDSPPACAVADSSSSPSTSTNSSPREPDAQYPFATNDPRAVVVAAPDEHIQVRGYSNESLPVLERDLRGTTSLPSLRTMGLDKSWNPPTDAMQHISVAHDGIRPPYPSHAPHTSHAPYPSYPSHHVQHTVPSHNQIQRQDDGRVPWSQQPPLQPTIATQTGVRPTGGMPRGLSWLDSE
ncbi:unnamed protein product [Somion occarium]